MNQSGEDFLHEAKVTVFDFTFNIPLSSHIFDYRPRAYHSDRSALRQIDLETQTFKFIHFVIVFILKLKVILLGYNLRTCSIVKPNKDIC